MGQTVSQGLLTVKAWFAAVLIFVGFMVDEDALGKVFL
jgi:hypothetical protein